MKNDNINDLKLLTNLKVHYFYNIIAIPGHTSIFKEGYQYKKLKLNVLNNEWEYLQLELFEFLEKKI